MANEFCFSLSLTIILLAKGVALTCPHSFDCLSLCFFNSCVCSSPCVCVCVWFEIQCVYLYAFVSALGSHEMGRHKWPISSQSIHWLFCGNNSFKGFDYNHTMNKDEMGRLVSTWIATSRRSHGINSWRSQGWGMGVLLRAQMECFIIKFMLQDKSRKEKMPLHLNC